MKQIRSITTLVVVITILALALPAAAQLVPDISVNAGVHSKYVWRALIVTDGPVLQPDAAISLGGATVGAWANVDLDDANERSGEVTEVDTWLEYGFALGPVDVGAGFIHYGYPDAEGDTSELYLYGSVGLLLSPTLVIYRDVDAVEGLYANLSVSHGIPLVPGQSLDLTAGLGVGDGDHNTAYYAGADGGAADLGMMASWTWQALPRLSVTPHVAWVTLLGDASDAMDATGADTSAFVFGATAGFNF